ncbi:hypothetical protein COE49_12235 [Bacillus sp. AFS029637]|nr:hypothetical protein COE49_12235 [Bacillus sp. AFS029637]
MKLFILFEKIIVGIKKEKPTKRIADFKRNIKLITKAETVNLQQRGKPTHSYWLRCEVSN